MHRPALSGKRLTAVAALACTAGLIPAAALAATTTAAAPAAASTPACRTSGLVVWMDTTATAPRDPSTTP